MFYHRKYTASEMMDTNTYRNNLTSVCDVHTMLTDIMFSTADGSIIRGYRLTVHE